MPGPNSIAAPYSHYRRSAWCYRRCLGQALACARVIYTPLLILHSERDQRAPISETEQLHKNLNGLAGEVQLVGYPHAGHDHSRAGEPLHHVDRLKRMVDGFDMHTRRVPAFYSGSA